MVWSFYLVLIWILVIHWQIAGPYGSPLARTPLAAGWDSDAPAPLPADWEARGCGAAGRACGVFYICASS